MLELYKGIGIRNREYIQWCSSDGGPRSSAVQKTLSSIVDVERGNTKASAADRLFS